MAEPRFESHRRFEPDRGSAHAEPTEAFPTWSILRSLCHAKEDRERDAAGQSGRFAGNGHRMGRTPLFRRLRRALALARGANSSSMPTRDYVDRFFFERAQSRRQFLKSGATLSTLATFP